MYIIKYGFFIRKVLKSLLKIIFCKKAKSIIRLILLLILFFALFYFHTWFYNYYLFLIGKYQLNLDALIRQNNTLKNIKKFTVVCNSNIKDQIENSDCLIQNARKHFFSSSSQSFSNFNLYKTKLDSNDLKQMQIKNITNGMYEPKVNCLNETIQNNLITIIIIPYLNREANLKELMFNLHKFLQRQFIRYQIFIAEQSNSNDPFNKGRLYNAAFKFILNYSSVYKIDCVIFHDIDLIPESDFNLYQCGSQPRHLSLMIRKNKHYEKYSYDFLVGGVLLMKPSVYLTINGMR